MTSAQNPSPAERKRTEIADDLRNSTTRLVGLIRLMYLSDFQALEVRHQEELFDLLDDLALRADSVAQRAAIAIEGDAE